MFSLLSKSALSLLLLAGASVAPTALADSPRILDLSQDFPVGDLNNQDAIFFEQFLTRDIRRFIVLDDGEVVMNYQRDSVRDDDVYNLWSASKAIMSFFVGTVLFSDQYNLTMNTTLGEIFVGENDWSEVTDLEELAFKKNVTSSYLKKKDLALSGSLMSINPDRIVLKRILLSGTPVKVKKKTAAERERGQQLLDKGAHERHCLWVVNVVRD